MFGARGGAMSEDRSDEDSQLMDLWISNYEQQYVDTIEAEPDYENQLHNEKELYCQQIWSNFQTTATAIAQLYKDRSQGTSFWSPFQTAAGTVTSLYKESTNNIRRCSELGIEAGRQKRSREIMNWAKKKRRNIRREELLAYLAGKPPPPRHSHRSSPRPRMMICGSPPSQGPAASMVVSSTPPPGSEPDPELHTFREALSGSPMSRRTGRQAELSAFISSEFARHVKRPASHDVDMGSPTHKRSRLM